MTMKLKLLEMLLPLLLGPLAFAVMQLGKRASDALDRLPAMTKRVVVLGLAWALTWVAHTLGVELQCDATVDAAACFGGMTQDTVQALLAALVAFALHGLKPKNTRDPVTGIEVRG
jgi:hypothetical protein